MNAVSPPARKVLLIGWDAADWKVIHPLLDAGKMPHLARLIEQGVMGNIATLQPCLSPMLWTSIATGKRPYKHGIHGFSEPDPVSGGIRPVTNLSRKTKAIWNILNQNGKHTITVGWWPSNPAEPLSHGVMVSNDYQNAHGPPDPWPLKPGTIHPERLEKHLTGLRFHPSELTEDDLRAFLPGLDGMSREDLDKAEKDPRTQTLMRIIADCTSIHSAATALMQNEPWDLMCVYFDAIDHFGHAFMKYHPPQRPQVDDWDYRVFNHCIEAGYRYHDAMLGTLLQLAGEDTTVILMSDHGFHPDDLRLNSIPREPAGPAAEHRQFGILVAKGPDLRRDERIYGANLLDVCPTLLHLFGLPVGEDMDGRVLTDLYDPQQGLPAAVERIPSWDEVAGDHGMHPPDRQIAPADSKAALDQLVALGYIDAPDADQSKALDQTVRELDYNLAQAYIDGGIYTEAVVLLERLYATWPMEHRFGFKLATCYQSQGRTADLRALVAQVSERRMQEAEEAIAVLEKQAPADEAAALAEKERIHAMGDEEKETFYRERREWLAKARPNLFSLRHLEACADFAEKKFEDALEKLEALDTDFGARRNALTLRGEVLQRLQRWPEARAAFEEALAFDREAPGPLLGLARTALAARDFPAAIDHARASLGLLYFQPRAHYLLGLAHFRMGDLAEAEQAFVTCITQAPLFTAALRMLAQIARVSGADAITQSQWHLQLGIARQRLAEIRQSHHAEVQDLHQHSLRSGDDPANRPMPVLMPRPEALADVPEQDIITIVSGLPRSGTSLLMQILQAAGIPAFTDGKRQADASNERGYYEHEKVGNLLQATDKSWLSDARGKSLKVVAPLLATLPAAIQGAGPDLRTLHYRVLFIERDMEEILASQEAMLARLGKATPGGADIAKAYLQQVRHAKTWLCGRGIPALSVSHAALIHRADEVLPDIAAFVGRPGQVDAMKAVIDPALHRVRK
jgi:tetratricopeptide (TPR) repeat protein/arylsulfatase A-like enzyme